MKPWMWGLIGAGAVGLGLYLWLCWDAINNVLIGRRIDEATRAAAVAPLGRVGRTVTPPPEPVQERPAQEGVHDPTVDPCGYPRRRLRDEHGRFIPKTRTDEDEKGDA